jgi:hypothetical protein
MLSVSQFILREKRRPQDRKPLRRRMGRKRPPGKLLGGFVMSELIRDGCELHQRHRMLRIGGENLPVNRLRLGELSGIVKSDGVMEGGVEGHGFDC